MSDTDESTIYSHSDSSSSSMESTPTIALLGRFRPYNAAILNRNLLDELEKTSNAMKKVTVPTAPVPEMDMVFIVKTISSLQRARTRIVRQEHLLYQNTLDMELNELLSSYVAKIMARNIKNLRNIVAELDRLAIDIPYLTGVKHNDYEVYKLLKWVLNLVQEWIEKVESINPGSSALAEFWLIHDSIFPLYQQLSCKHELNFYRESENDPDDQDFTYPAVESDFDPYLEFLDGEV